MLNITTTSAFLASIVRAASAKDDNELFSMRELYRLVYGEQSETAKVYKQGEVPFYNYGWWFEQLTGAEVRKVGDDVLLTAEAMAYVIAKIESRARRAKNRQVLTDFLNSLLLPDGEFPKIFSAFDLDGYNGEQSRNEKVKKYWQMQAKTASKVKAEVQANATALWAEIAGLQERDNEQQIAINDLQTEVDEHSLQIAELQHENAIQNVRITNLEAENAGIKAENAGIKAENAGIKASIKRLEQDFGLMRTINASLQQELDELKATLAKVIAQVKKVGKKVKEGRQLLAECLDSSTKAESWAEKVKRFLGI